MAGMITVWLARPDGQYDKFYVYAGRHVVPYETLAKNICTQGSLNFESTNYALEVYAEDAEEYIDIGIIPSKEGASAGDVYKMHVAQKHGLTNPNHEMDNSPKFTYGGITNPSFMSPTGSLTDRSPDSVLHSSNFRCLQSSGPYSSKKLHNLDAMPMDTPKRIADGPIPPKMPRIDLPNAKAQIPYPIANEPYASPSALIETSVNQTHREPAHDHLENEEQINDEETLRLEVLIAKTPVGADKIEFRGKSPTAYNSPIEWLQNEFIPIVNARSESIAAFKMLLSKNPLFESQRNGIILTSQEKERNPRTHIVRAMTKYLQNFWNAESFHVCDPAMRKKTVHLFFQAFPFLYDISAEDLWTNNGRTGHLDVAIKNAMSRGLESWNIKEIASARKDRPRQKRNSNKNLTEEEVKLLVEDGETKRLETLVQTMNGYSMLTMKREIFRDFATTKAYRRMLMNKEIARVNGDPQAVGTAFFYAENFKAVTKFDNLVHEDFLHFMECANAKWNLTDLTAQWRLVKHSFFEHMKDTLSEETQCKSVRPPETLVNLYNKWKDLDVSTEVYEDEVDDIALQFLSAYMIQAYKMARFKVDHQRFLVRCDRTAHECSLNDYLKMSLKSSSDFKAKNRQKNTSQDLSNVNGPETSATQQSSLRNSVPKRSNYKELMKDAMKQPYIVRFLTGEHKFTYAVMVDGKKFECKDGFISAVRLAIELSYVCMLEWDLESTSLWKFFETLYGINVSSKGVSTNILKIVNTLVKEETSMSSLNHRPAFI